MRLSTVVVCLVAAAVAAPVGEPPSSPPDGNSPSTLDLEPKDANSASTPPGSTPQGNTPPDTPTPNTPPGNTPQGTTPPPSGRNARSGFPSWMTPDWLKRKQKEVLQGEQQAVKQQPTGVDPNLTPDINNPAAGGVDSASNPPGQPAQPQAQPKPATNLGGWRSRIFGNKNKVNQQQVAGVDPNTTPDGSNPPTGATGVTPDSDPAGQPSKAKSGNKLSWLTDRLPGNKNKVNQQQAAGVDPGTTPDGSNPLAGASGNAPDPNTPASKPKLGSKITGALGSGVNGVKRFGGNLGQSLKNELAFTGRALKTDWTRKADGLKLRGQDLKYQAERLGWGIQDRFGRFVPEGLVDKVRGAGSGIASGAKQVVSKVVPERLRQGIASKIPEGIRNKFSPPSIDAPATAATVDALTPETPVDPAEADPLAQKQELTPAEKQKLARFKHNSRPLTPQEVADWKKYKELVKSGHIPIRNGNDPDIITEPSSQRDMMMQERIPKKSVAWGINLLNRCKNIEGRVSF